jgi:hypothetical protein
VPCGCDPPSLDSLLHRFASNGTWLDPTVQSFRYYAPKQWSAIFSEFRELVPLIRQNNVPILAGTDSSTFLEDRGDPPGVSLHDELGLLVDAGFTQARELSQLPWGQYTLRAALLWFAKTLRTRQYNDFSPWRSFLGLDNRLIEVRGSCSLESGWNRLRLGPEKGKSLVVGKILVESTPLPHNDSAGRRVSPRIESRFQFRSGLLLADLLACPWRARGASGPRGSSERIRP